MDIQTLAGSPRNERGGGQVSRLLLAAGQFGSRQLSVTGIDASPAASSWWICRRPHRRPRPPSPARHGRSRTWECEMRAAFPRLAEMRSTMTGEGAYGDCW